MAVRRFLKVLGNGNLQQMTDAEMDKLILLAVRQWAANPTAEVQYFDSGGNAGTMNDTVLVAGQAVSTNSSFRSEAQTPDAAVVINNSYNHINATAQTILSVPPDTGNLAFPIFLDGFPADGNLRSCSLQDMVDTIWGPAIDLLASSSEDYINVGGTYAFYKNGEQPANTTLVRAQPVFTDTINTRDYSSNESVPYGTGSTLQVQDSWYLYRYNLPPAPTGVVYPAGFAIQADVVTGIGSFSSLETNTLWLEGMLWASRNSPGYILEYNINGTGAQKGQTIEDTRRVADRYIQDQDADVYYTQEVPTGSYAVANTYTLRLGKLQAASTPPTWSLIHTLNNPNAFGTSQSDNFGYQAAMSGTYIAISAHREDSASDTSSGAVYVYNKFTGSLLYTLTNPNAYNDPTENSDTFGSALAINDGYLIVGAGEDKSSANQDELAGAIYIFNVSNGALLYSIINPDTAYTGFQAGGDAFGSYALGSTVAISEFDSGGSNPGTMVVVGAPDDGTTLFDKPGSVYWYDASNGTTGSGNAGNMQSPDNTGADDIFQFGYGVAVDNQYTVVGSPENNKAYIINSVTGSILYTLTNPGGLDYPAGSADQFGFAVAIYGIYAIIGAPGTEKEGAKSAIEDAGAVHVYNVTTGLKVRTIMNPANDDARFGSSVDIHSGFCIVGAWDYQSQGRAYIFNATTGDLQHTFINENADTQSTADKYGWRVALNGNHAVITAYDEDDANLGSGKAYIYQLS